MGYEGRLEVEDDDFELQAKALIARDNELSLALIRRDEFGQFEIEGIAEKTEHGFYLASRLPLIYPDYDPEDYEEYATLNIDYVRFSPKMSRCTISGIWKQIQGDEWKFRGVLNAK